MPFSFYLPELFADITSLSVLRIFVYIIFFSCYIYTIFANLLFSYTCLFLFFIKSLFRHLASSTIKRHIRRLRYFYSCIIFFLCPFFGLSLGEFSPTDSFFWLQRFSPFLTTPCFSYGFFSTILLFSHISAFFDYTDFSPTCFAFISTRLSGVRVYNWRHPTTHSDRTSP